MQLQSEKEEIEFLIANQFPTEFAAPVVGKVHTCVPPPGWFTCPVARKTQPCCGIVVDDRQKGLCVVAARDFAVGDVVAIDFSTFSWPTSPSIFGDCRAIPPSSSLWHWWQQSGEQSLNRSNEIELAQMYLAEHDALFADCDVIFKRAAFVYGPSFAQLAFIPALCSLLVTFGDTKMLLSSNWPEHCPASHSNTCGAGESVEDRFVAQLQLRSDVNCGRIRDLLSDWDQHLKDSSPTEREQRLQLADAALDCVPPEYFAVVPAEESGFRMGFMARCGLDTPLALAKFFAVCDCNALDVSVPSLPRRMALFPFVRFFEHECRPSCALSTLDNPDTHADDFIFLREVDSLTSPVDQYEQQTAKQGGSKRNTSSASSNFRYASRRIFAPCAALVTAIRPITKGEPLTISYIASTYMTQRERTSILKDSYAFNCSCRWCTTEPDLTRSFRCPECPRNCGVICPTGDGTRWSEWACLQCGFHPDFELVTTFLEQEKKLATVKADKTIGMAKLLGDDYLHYTHAVVFRKADNWSEESWKQQDAKMCLNYVEMLIKCTDRVMQECDPCKAQYHEFLAQMNHAVGNAHTSRYEYEIAYKIRCSAGQRLTYWATRTRYMARDKSLADLMDSK